MMMPIHGRSVEISQWLSVHLEILNKTEEMCSNIKIASNLPGVKSLITSTVIHCVSEVAHYDDLPFAISRGPLHYSSQVMPPGEETGTLNTNDMIHL